MPTQEQVTDPPWKGSAAKVFYIVCLLLVCQVNAYTQTRKPRRPQPRPTTQVQAIQRTQWQPIVEMDGLLFPSIILATANIKTQSPSATYIGDINGKFGVSIVNPENGTRISVTIQVDNIADPLV